jgi:flagellar protein FlgJ
MNSVTGTGSISLGKAAPDRERLDAAMRQLEGVFVQQLFKAMRETVPDEGVVSRGSGEEIFTSLLDERLASVVPEAWERDGLAEALRRQFRVETSAAEPAASHGASTEPSDSNRTGSEA